MKELFNKLSNLFSFGKEARLVNVETPDRSGPDDSNIDPMEVQEAPDMSGPTEEPSPFEKEKQLIAKAEVKLEEMQKPKPRKLTKEEEYILNFEDEKPLEQKKPELSKQEKDILDFEKPGGETVLPKQAEYLKAERTEASEGKDVSREVIKKYYNYLRSVLKNFSPNDLKIANNILFSRAYDQNEMGTSPEDTMKYVKVLQEGGKLGTLVEKAIELYKADNQEDVEAFSAQFDANVRDRTRTSEATERMGADYLGIEKDAIKREADTLIANFTAQPYEEEPVYVAEAETKKPIKVSDAFVEKWTGGEEDDEEWGSEKMSKKTPAEEVEELRQELAGKTRIAGTSKRKTK